MFVRTARAGDIIQHIQTVVLAVVRGFDDGAMANKVPPFLWQVTAGQLPEIDIFTNVGICRIYRGILSPSFQKSALFRTEIALRSDFAGVDHTAVA